MLFVLSSCFIYSIPLANASCMSFFAGLKRCSNSECVGAMNRGFVEAVRSLCFSHA